MFIEEDFKKASHEKIRRVLVKTMRSFRKKDEMSLWSKL
jgi:hypothetical protein